MFDKVGAVVKRCGKMLACAANGGNMVCKKQENPVT